MSDVVAWVMAHLSELAMVLLALLSVAELVTRLTPTKKDDGFVERVGGIIRRMLDFLKIPNTKA